MKLSGKSVVVTGADGFIGSHLAERLVHEGAQVHCLAQYNSFGSSGWLDTLPTALRSSFSIDHGDVRDGGQMANLLKGADVVFHLAALIAIPQSYQAPQSFLETNVTGTFNILEACRRHDIEKVILTSTSEVYGTPISTPISVAHPLQAQSPYAASKVASDQLGLAYASSFGVNVAVLRPFNTYGPRQSLRAVIPTVLAQMQAGCPEVLLGSLYPRRDFTYVSDTVEGFVMMAEAETAPGEVIQLGTGVAVSIGELVEICRSITGSTAPVRESEERVRPENSEVQVLLSDPSQAFRSLGWQPSISLDEGLRMTAQWVLESAEFGAVDRYHR